MNILIIFIIIMLISNTFSQEALIFFLYCSLLIPFHGEFKPAPLSCEETTLPAVLLYCFYYCCYDLSKLFLCHLEVMVENSITTKYSNKKGKEMAYLKCWKTTWVWLILMNGVVCWNNNIIYQKFHCRYSWIKRDNMDVTKEIVGQ